jgi:hypothetical protein
MAAGHGLKIIIISTVKWELLSHLACQSVWIKNDLVGFYQIMFDMYIFNKDK